MIACALSSSKSWGVNGHTTQCTSPQYKMVSVVGLQISIDPEAKWERVAETKKYCE